MENTKLFFPGVTEELIEEALKKIFSDQQYAIHDPEKTESWIRFTLGMIQKALKTKDDQEALMKSSKASMSWTKFLPSNI